MKLLGVIVLYYPDENVPKNIDTYLDRLDKLIVWDNTPINHEDKPHQNLITSHPEKIINMGSGINEGIGVALNTAARYALDNEFTHLLTFDQDSYFKEEDFSKYLEHIHQYGENKAVIFSTNYHILSQQKAYYPVIDKADKVNTAMTSGSNYPVEVFRKIGFFMDNLFVWGIDCEFCWRAAKNNIDTVCFKDILLQHDLGYQKKKRYLLGKEVFPNEYQPDRTYYNVRNGIILHREYPQDINLKKHLKYHFFKRMVFVLLFEEQKLQKIKALFQGYIDGKRNKTGKRA